VLPGGKERNWTPIQIIISIIIIVFISRLYFSAVNQKHYNMIICCHCTVRGKNPVKALVIIAISGVIFLFFFQGLLDQS